MFYFVLWHLHMVFWKMTERKKDHTVTKPIMRPNPTMNWPYSHVVSVQPKADTDYCSVVASIVVQKLFNHKHEPHSLSVQHFDSLLLWLPHKSNFHRHRDMNMCNKHIAKDCLTCNEIRKIILFTCAMNAPWACQHLAYQTEPRIQGPIRWSPSYPLATLTKLIGISLVVIGRLWWLRAEWNVMKMWSTKTLCWQETTLLLYGQGCRSDVRIGGGTKVIFLFFFLPVCNSYHATINHNFIEAFHIIQKVLHRESFIVLTFLVYLS